MVNWTDEQLAQWEREQLQLQFKPPKRARLPKQPPPRKQSEGSDENGFKGVLTRCPDCGAGWENARRRFTRLEHGVDYDYFICACGREWTRYK